MKNYNYLDDYLFLTATNQFRNYLLLRWKRALLNTVLKYREIEPSLIVLSRDDLSEVKVVLNLFLHIIRQLLLLKFWKRLRIRDKNLTMRDIAHAIWLLGTDKVIDRDIRGFIEWAKVHKPNLAEDYAPGKGLSLE